MSLVLFMLFLSAATFAILEQQKQRLIENAKATAADDIRFIKFLTNGVLQQQNYERLDSLVTAWGKHVRNTHELKVTAANGFVFADFQQDKPVIHPYQFEESISYSYQGKASLLFVKDLGDVYVSVDHLRWQLIIGLILIGLVLWRMTWLGLHKKQKALALDSLYHQLQDSTEQLRSTRTYLKSIIDSMPSTLVGVDAKGRITLWNSSAVQLSGLSSNEVQGKLFAEALPDYASQMQGLKDAILTGTPTRTERQLTRADNTTHYSEIVVYPLDSVEEPGAVIRIDDITRRIKMEQMMVQSEKMMTVGGLAAGMAHEINNPLSGILQCNQNILRRISPDLPANQKIASELGLDLAAMNAFLEKRSILEFLDGIREAGERASRIVADMLAFSRRSSAEFSQVSINDLLDAVVRISANDYNLKKTYDFKQIDIVKEYDPELPAVSCDHTEIEQVLLNLVKNAAHAISGNESDTNPRIVLRTATEGNQVRIEVEDVGTGMDDETRRRVFEPFFTTKPIGLGTGLGLSVSYYIITEQHKGAIMVESTVGKGSRFIIRLPIKQQES